MAATAITRTPVNPAAASPSDPDIWYANESPEINHINSLENLRLRRKLILKTPFGLSGPLTLHALEREEQMVQLAIFNSCLLKRTAEGEKWGYLKNQQTQPKMLAKKLAGGGEFKAYETGFLGKVNGPWMHELLGLAEQLCGPDDGEGRVSWAGVDDGCRRSIGPASVAKMKKLNG
ncbi:hypothetical protein CEP52_017663 [Fusarium oligoseptatum]|uniref:Uncharacterized protein n=1 Tax=Fusarium oligoseptatum TaxID=2604345 RepID=A0A428RKQ6_9HYPO|nr:hypothetical protein CEP52_017663 [Fusarium oligoseptatum]